MILLQQRLFHGIAVFKFDEGESANRKNVYFLMLVLEE